MTDLSFIQFAQPGWDVTWSQRGDLLVMHWDMDDSDGLEPVHIGTQVLLERCGGDYARAAWFCIKHAVLHEAGEWLSINGKRPYHPHVSDWWWQSYRAGPEALTEVQVNG